MNEIHYERLRPAELEAIVRDRPVAYVPIGTLEWHGRHLPVGLDALKAHAVCERLAVRTGGVVLPASYFSMLGMNFPWTFKYSPAAFTGSIFSTLGRLRRYGFKVIFLITGHYPIEQICVLIAAAHAFMAVSDCTVVAGPEFFGAFDEGYSGDHAAKWETSLMMELFPELVDIDELAKFQGKKFFSLSREGVMGQNPAETASRETGAVTLEAIIDTFSNLAEELLITGDKNTARNFHRNSLTRLFGMKIKEFIEIGGSIF